jgi:hypothetical protein
VTSGSNLALATGILAAVVGENETVLVSIIPSPFAVSVYTVIETGDNEIGFLILSIIKEKEEPATFPEVKPYVIVRVSVEVPTATEQVIDVSIN